MTLPPSVHEATAPPRRMISRGLRRLILHSPNKVAQEVMPLAPESNVVPSPQWEPRRKAQSPSPSPVSAATAALAPAPASAPAPAAALAAAMAAAPAAAAAAATPATARKVPAGARFRVVGPGYGCGSYGKVLRGVDTHTGCAVAIKAVAEGRMRPGALEREVAVISGFSAGAAGVTCDTGAAGGAAGAPAGPAHYAAHPKTHANIAQVS